MQDINSDLLQKKAERRYQFEIIYLLAGKLQLQIDDELFTLHSGDAITVTPLQYLEFGKTEGLKGFRVTFSYDFFCTDQKKRELIYSYGLFCHFGLNEILRQPAKDQDKTLQSIFLNIQRETQVEEFEFETMVRSMLEQIIVVLLRIKKTQNGGAIYRPSAKFLDFLDLIRANFGQDLSIPHIASQLSLSEDALYDLSQSTVQDSPKNVIRDLIVAEAKRLLRYEKLSVKETAHQLGFSDQYYFSRFFKKHTEERPKDYVKTQIR